MDYVLFAELLRNCGILITIITLYTSPLPIHPTIWINGVRHSNANTKFLLVSKNVLQATISYTEMKITNYSKTVN